MRFFILLIAVYFQIQQAQASKKQIKSLVIFFRHGSRTTNHKHYYNNELWQGYQRGDLTKKGHTELHGLGQTFREIYGQFLQINQEVNEQHNEETLSQHDNLSQEHVRVKHSHIERTRSSLMSFLLGAFPNWFHPDASPHNEHLNKPIRNLKTTNNKDKLKKDYTFLLGEEQCPLIKKIRNKVFQSKPMNFMQDIITQSYEYQKIRAKIREVEGFKMIQGHGYEDLADIYDIYMCHKSEGLPIPNFDKSDISFIQMGTQFFIDEIYFGHRSLVKLASQKFFHDLLRIIESKNPKKLHIFSGHEVNIISLFMNMLTRDEQNTMLGRSFHTKLLPFAAHVIIEFLNNGNIKFLYDFKPLKIKLCQYQEECDGKLFKTFLKTRILPNARQLCFYHHKHILEREEEIKNLQKQMLQAPQEDEEIEEQI
ncbi:histidine phosphatase family (branch 2) protein (macronuclear) [Tetrahymena thermophila SB210]|uniref:Histidine phosphatase family (Branch 2) protein n=1 Tax=Tetrahymena thermophila (strain SB210) TaxID=312017 RepID=I7M929_TETTS|nr:histidine phosphatase family (branch 2) protein [Tetrahymena thermophila SB210]EAS00597.2 histidine phosphatase family (branch 2) protein [Tetrahymena thermophila SB210]|eukprot:XP_001020842.2 histidine phosphatase family (branch 2) protein [Tetrahymena thermophila SB210]